MQSSVPLSWQASWIWGSGPASPRNEWRCFRRSFVPEGSFDQAIVRLTADSRYILYVNGVRVGRGPVRSWPFELACDEYDVGHLLRPNAENVIAVLATHYGLATFQYLRGRGGLLLQLEAREKSGRIDPIVTSGETWRTAIHQGFDRRSSRISCQLGFTEIVDARAWSDDWLYPGFDDSGWERAAVIGPAGTAPWTRLIKRDIPYLTEEPVYPARVESLSAVIPVRWRAVLDLRCIMMPESADLDDNVSFCGYLAAMVRLERTAPFTIGIPDGGRSRCTLSVDGSWLEEDRFAGEHPERYVTIDLSAGEHFLLLDVTGTDHGHGCHIGFDCDAPFDVYAPPIEAERPDEDSAAGAAVPFIRIGPFDAIRIIDHQPGRELNRNHPDYLALRTAAAPEDLRPFARRIRPVDPLLVNPHDVFTANVWKKSHVSRPVPASLQYAVTAGPDPAVIPIESGADTEIVIDFGRELSGYAVLELDAAAGTIVDGCGFEYMRDGWRQHTYLLDNTFRYICREGRQTFVSAVRRGLRYLTLTFRDAARPVRLYAVKMLQSNYPVAQVGAFRCSDPLLNDIWTISRDTTRLCMEDTFVDCPAFEQAFWVGDARNEALVNYYTFGAREIVERCLRLVPGSAFQTPLYADQVPSGWNSVIPNWTFFWANACLEYYRYDGSLTFIAEMWPHIDFTLRHYLQKRNDQGLLEHNGWNLLDWAPFEQPREGVVTPQNMILVQTLLNAAEIARIVGQPERAAALGQEATRLREAIDRHLWDESRGAYVDCLHKDGRPSATVSMQTQIIAYLCDIPAGERLRRIERYLVEPPASFVPAGSPFMLFFYYEALVKLGRCDLMMADMRRNYGYMIEQGATTCWEMFPWSEYNRNPKMLTRSHCHAWSAGPAYFLGAQVLGVQGVTPGWTRVRIAPQPCGLAWASGSVPLPHDGRIDVSWRIEGERTIALRIDAPPQVEILTEAPEGYALTVERP
jgi:hypothetical protein